MNRRSFLGKAFGAVAGAIAAAFTIKRTERGRWIGMDGQPTGEATSSAYDQIAWPVTPRKWAGTVPRIVAQETGRELTPIEYEAWTPGTGWYRGKFQPETPVQAQSEPRGFEYNFNS